MHPLIIDIAGTRLDAAERERLQHPLVGGLIYFGRNWESRAQISELSAEIKSIRPDILIAVDHEGGRVQRFRTDGFTRLPPMRALGELWRQGQGGKRRLNRQAQHASQVATACGYVLASELRACGIDFSFTPVLDLDYGESSVIGDRAFDADPHLVTQLAQSLMLGLLQAGMGNCGKHFPGHGYVKADSHVAIPVDKRSLKRILKDDARPYGWLNNTLTAVMPAHVIYPKVDARPAGFSDIWIQDILRGELDFRGAVISDDLSMQGARQMQGRTLTHGEAAVAAIRAGCDLVLLCNQSLDGGQALDAAMAHVSEAVVKQQLPLDEASELRRRALLPASPAPDWDELMCSSAYMQALDLLSELF